VMTETLSRRRGVVGSVDGRVSLPKRS
jgi:hypothetical protein